MKRLIVIAAMAVLAGCSKAPAATVTRQVSGEVVRLPDAYSSSVYRVEDPERGVTCYVSDGYKFGGISCVKNLYG